MADRSRDKQGAHRRKRTRRPPTSGKAMKFLKGRDYITWQAKEDRKPFFLYYSIYRKKKRNKIFSHACVCQRVVKPLAAWFTLSYDFFSTCLRKKSKFAPMSPCPTRMLHILPREEKMLSLVFLVLAIW